MVTGGDDTTSPRSTIITHNPSGESVMGADGGRDNATSKPSASSKSAVVNSDDGGDVPEVSPDVTNERQVTPEKKESSDRTNSPPAPTHSFSYPHGGGGGYHAHLTPQPASGYYHNVGYQTQMTPEPPSPAGPGAVYDMGSFFHQQAAFAPLNSPFGASPQYPGGLQAPPLSPTRTFSSGSMVIPPASPLFPRVQTSLGSVSFEQQRSQLDSRTGAVTGAGTPLSPSVPYLSTALGTAVYPGYGNNGNAASQSNSSDDITGWGERGQQNVYPHTSPQMNAQVLPIQYSVSVVRTASNSSRSYSFDETMLPPAAIDPQDQSNPTYSPYGSSQSGSVGAAAAAAGGTLFAHQQPWGYGQDIYNSPVSPLQPRPSAHILSPYPPSSGGMRQIGPYGQFYPASSPGPPIQTTTSNKGPEGANLFIFHIPNHFTNLDMYHLFCPYGNLLSVRIMVEKDTGRSRGFGFVSYDSPESAALAIKELNGFVIGNKRLKVQHKQIRANEQQHRDMGGFATSEGAFARVPGSLPPAGASVLGSSSPWYDTRKSAPQAGLDEESDPDDHHHHSLPPEMDHQGLLDGSEQQPSGGLSGLSSLEPLRNALPDVDDNDEN